MVNITVKGERELQFAVDKMKDLTLIALSRIIKKSSFIIERQAKENLSGRVLKVGRSFLKGRPPGGQLRRSITTEFKEGKSPSARIGSKLIYASVHEFGATIRAKRVKYLKFFIPGVGWRQKKSVVIPPRPYMLMAFNDSLQKIDNIISAELKKVVK